MIWASSRQEVGIQYIVSLPKPVLIGDQSSGKSGLILAIASLNLPTSSGSCGRGLAGVVGGCGERKKFANGFRVIQFDGHS
ncbi:hypothetical protein QBC32DRAFT_357312 [Pseudoneurospora amorphoporcata]|uniref:Uncharacterized protein n=1 Tax=Pseudoneurospora amorphoporcata TaxID=241081 RepID=A0AAN6NK63_9PEZI|nr:hypothetical protein QBC32DRAFT_357312 [Pseudoneurospora amorphoporcata]